MGCKQLVGVGRLELKLGLRSLSRMTMPRFAPPLPADRCIDTAHEYQNQIAIGEAIR